MGAAVDHNHLFSRRELRLEKGERDDQASLLVPRRTFSIVAKCRPAAFTRSGERTQEEESCRRGSRPRRSPLPDAFKPLPVIMADVRSLRVPVVCRLPPVYSWH